MRKSLLTVGIFIGILFLTNACQQSNSSPDSLALESTPPTVHVAFAGGGWRAHTAHSAWTIALLNGKNSLSDIFKNVGSFSSNSGGSWFSTMLMYSSQFIKEIEESNAASTWTSSSGWIAQQKILFDAAPCSLVPDDLYLECVFDHYTNKSITGGTYWKLVVDKLVFNGYSLGNATLSTTHQKWALDKPLLLASSLLTNTVVLNSENNLSNNHNYYQVCLSPNTPVLNGDSGSSCNPSTIQDVTPVTFSSTSQSGNFTSSPFFALPTLGKTNFNLGYSADYVLTTPPKFSESINLPIDYSKVKVMSAAAASSAALGFGASERITDDFDLSYDFIDDAISFSLANSKVQYMDTDNMSLKDLASSKAVRLADGGAVDNAGVAQLVRSLQLNQQDQGFHIVAFDNVSTITDPGGKGAKVGIDIASLFGYKDSLCVDLKLTQYCIETPPFTIFDTSPLYNTGHSWIHNSGSNYLVYTKYKVTTVANPDLGIKAGSTGYIHSFTCAYPSAITAPADGDANFQAYFNMFDFIINGLKDKNNQGLKLLESAMGL